MLATAKAKAPIEPTNRRNSPTTVLLNHQASAFSSSTVHVAHQLSMGFDEALAVWL
jgi:hypothetical protein